MYTFNSTTTTTVTDDAKNIKVKLLGNVQGDFQLDEKTMCIQVFQSAYKQYHWQRHSIIDSNIIETFIGANSIGN